MTDNIEQQIIERTKTIVEAASAGDLNDYRDLITDDITAVVPGSRNVPVQGRDFHEYYFRLDQYDRPVNNTINNVQVRALGEDTVLIVYNRLQQSAPPGGEPETRQFTETRIWERRDGTWKNSHLHRTRIR